jgi:PAS domain S-box-containing protein
MQKGASKLVGIKAYINGLSIQSLGRYSIGALVAIVIIFLSVNVTFSNNMYELNQAWKAHSQSTLKKNIYISFIRQSLGYGGMIHHFKNYILRSDADNLIEAHFHILELRTFLVSYRTTGANNEEELNLIELEQVVDRYFNALSLAEELKHQGYGIAEIDKMVTIDDELAFKAIMKLDTDLFRENEDAQNRFSENVNRLTEMTLIFTIMEAVIFAFLILIIGWIFRKRIVDLYAREVDKKKKTQEEQAKITTMVNSIQEGLVTIDSKGTILTINDAVIDIYGYERKDLIGKNVKILVPAPHYAKHDAYIKSYLKTGQAKIIGTAREQESIRANGQSFPVYLNIGEMEVSGERQFVGTIRDITDKQAADRAKKHFIATVSHELRTPLTAIQGALGMISTGVLGSVPGKIDGLINVALNNTKRLVLLVNDLLDLEKLDSSEMRFDYSEQALSEIVGNAYYSNIPYADKYNIELNLTGKGRGLNVWADAKRLEQVITNLLSNAIKFSPENGVVTINFYNKNGVARVEVSDKGKGIPEDFQKIIFKRFSQADNSDAREKGGTGLGLAISKVIVENHSGKIGFDSKKGQGTVFYFELPVYHKQPITKVELNEDYLNSKILIVEDVNPQADLLSKHIGGYGFKPIAVGSIAQARNQMHSSPIDVLIIDLDSVDFDKSIKLVENLRLSKTREKFPIVFLSEEIELYKSRSVSIRYEVNLWLEKPFTLGQFLTLLDETIMPAKFNKPKVLIINNDDGLAISLKKHIEGVASITIASSPLEAKICYEHIDFDIYIIDPDSLSSGLKTLESDLADKIKKNEIRIIYYSKFKIKRPLASKETIIFDKNIVSMNEVLATIKSMREKLISGAEK